ncbi:MAG: YncE family protein [Deltaproteobacteria bacterium]|nr:YncE family protein [Deltaproteobacteria bacterium]
MSKRLGFIALLGLTAIAFGLQFSCGNRVLEPYDGSAFARGRPAIVWPQGPSALTSDNGSDTMSVIALNGMRTVVVYPVGLDPLANDAPHHLAIDAQARRVFTAYAYPPPVLSPGPHGNHGVSTQLGVLVALSLDDLHVIAQADVESNPGDVLLTPDRQRVVVTHFELNRVLASETDSGVMPARESAITVHNAQTLQRVASARPCLTAHGGAISPDSRWLYLACNGSDSLAIVDLQSPTLQSRLVPVGPGASTVPSQRFGPYAVSLTRDGRTGYVSNLEGRDVREFRVSDDGATVQFDNTRAVRTNGAAYFADLSADERSLIVPTQNPDQLLLIDRATMTIRQARSVPATECRLPHQVKRSPDNRTFVVCEGVHTALRSEPGALLQINPETLETLGRAATGVFPDAVDFVPEMTR